MAHLNSDGASEIVGYKSARSHGKAVEPSVFKGLGAKPDPFKSQQGMDFISMRRCGQPPIRVSLTHIPAFKELWRLWLAARIGGKTPSFTAQQINVALKMPLSSLRTALSSLAQNGMVRIEEEFIGINATRYLYTPTETGINLLALVEFLGTGGMIQVGKTSKVWRATGFGQPNNLFQHAALITGGPLDAEV